MIAVERRRRTLARALARLGLGLALVLAAIFAIAETPWGRQKLRAELSGLIRNQLGLEADLAYVRLEPTLLPPGVEVVARGISLAHPTEGRLVTATRLAVQPSLSSLLFGKLDLRRIELRDPHVRLVIRDGALVNGPTLPPSDDDSETRLPFRYLTIDGAVVRVVGDAPVTGYVEGVSAEIAVSGYRTMAVDLRVANGLVYHPRGEEPIESLVVEGVYDLDRGLALQRLRLRTPSARIAVREASLPLPWDRRVSGTIDAHLDVTRIGTAFAEDLGIPLSGAIDLHGSGFLDHDRYGGRGHVVLDGFGIDGRRIGEPLEFDVDADGTELHLTNGRMQMPGAGGSVGVTATLGLADPYPLQAGLDFRDMDLAALLAEIGVTPDAIVSWRFRGPARLHGQLLPFGLVGSLDVDTHGFEITSGPWHRVPRERILAVPHGTIHSRVDLDADGLTFADIDLVTPHSRLRADAFISFHDTFEVRASSERFDLADVSPLLDFTLAGAGPMEVRVGGLYSEPELDGHARLAGFAFDGMPVGDLELRADFEEGGNVAHFGTIEVANGESRYTVSDLRLDFTEHLEIDADVALDSVTFADLYRTFHLDQDPRFEDYVGNATGVARIHYTTGFPDDGPTGTLVTDLDLQLPRTELTGYAFADGRFRGQLRWYDFGRGFDGAEVDVDELVLRKAEGTVAVTGTIAQEGALDLRVVADRLGLRDLEGIGDSFPELEGQVGLIGRISSTIAMPHADLDLVLSDVSWAEQELGDARFYVKLVDQHDPYVAELGDVDPRSRAVATLPCARSRLGLLHADWPEDPPVMTADGPTVPLDRAQAYLVCGSGFDGRLDVDLALGFTEASPYRGRITFAGFDVTPFFPSGPTGPLATGRISGTIDLTGGSIDAPETTSGAVVLTSIEVDASGVPITNRGPWEMDVARGVANVRSATMIAEGTALSLTGNVSSEELALSLAGDVGMDVFAAAVPALASASGAMRLRILVRGPLADPEVIGEATLLGVGFEHAAVPLAIRELGGRIAFSQRRIAIENVRGRIGSGTIAIDGSAAIDGGRPSSARVSVALQDVAFRPDEGIEVAFGGTLVGTWDRSRELPLLQGTVDLLRARYTRPVQVTPTLGQLYRPTRTVVDTYDPANDYVELDLRVIQHAPAEIRNNLVDLDVSIDDAERPFRIVGTNQRIGALGTLAIPRGRMFFRGTSFDIRRGTLEFDDRLRLHPRFDVLATTEIRRNYDSTAPTFRIQLAATGDSDAFTLNASSTPSLSQQDIMLLLMVGMTSSELQNLQASQLSTTALDALSSLTGVEGRLTQALRVVDEVSLTTTYHPITNRPEPQLTVGSRITDRIRVTASTGLTSESRSVRATVEWRIDEHTSLQGGYDNINRETASAFGNLGVDVRYRLEFE